MGQRTGSVKRRGDRWEVRFVYVDAVTGKYRELRRKVESKVAGHDLLREFERSVSRSSDGFANRERRTFNDLADYYAKNYARPAEYSEGRKVFGLRSYKAALGYVEILRRQFGERKLRTLTYGDMLAFKVMLMNKPTRTNRDARSHSAQPRKGSVPLDDRGGRQSSPWLSMMQPETGYPGPVY